MELDALRRYRRVLSAAVSASAIALVMAKVGGSAAAGSPSGGIASLAFIVSLALLLVVWRKEHAAQEAAFAARERQQLALLELQLALAKKRGEDPGARRGVE